MFYLEVEIAGSKTQQRSMQIRPNTVFTVVDQDGLGAVSGTPYLGQGVKGIGGSRVQQVIDREAEFDTGGFVSM